LNKADRRFSPDTFEGQPFPPNTLPCATHSSILYARLKVHATVDICGLPQSSSLPLKSVTFIFFCTCGFFTTIIDYLQKLASPTLWTTWRLHMAHMEGMFYNLGVDNQTPSRIQGSHEYSKSTLPLS
jgi:hypothetical protein